MHFLQFRVAAKRVPCVPRSSRSSTIGRGKRKRPRGNALSRSKRRLRSRVVSFVKEKKAGRVSRMKIVARLYDARVAMLGHRLSAASRRNIGATPEQVRGRPRTSKRHDAWCVDDDDDDEDDDDQDDKERVNSTSHLKLSSTLENPLCFKNAQTDQAYCSHVS